VLTKSSSIGDLGCDAIMARTMRRDPQSNRMVPRFYIPGGLVKGLLREAWQEIGHVIDAAYLDLQREWLGDASAPASADKPLRGKLRFGDFVDGRTDAASAHRKRFRIQIDDERGAADGQMLQVIDSPYSPGEDVEFSGTLAALVPDGAPVPTEAIQRGLLWIRAVGGNRTVGFGELLSVDVKAIRSTSKPVKPTDAAFFELRYRFTDPLIVSRRRIAENLFESDEVVSGAVFIGAVAEMLRTGGFSALRSELSRVRFTHAFPALGGGERPRRIPLSLAWFKDIALDVIRCGHPVLRNDVPPAFDVDWKDSVARRLSGEAGWPRPEKELRVRTAIAGETGAAKDERLFGWKTVLPWSVDSGADLEWVGYCDTSALSPQARTELLEVLSFGIEPVGKTKARAQVSVSPLPPPSLENSDTYVVTLQTPALLLYPPALQREEPGVTTPEPLLHAYRAAWNALCGNSVQLIRFFARCSLAGGPYFTNRFSFKKQYKPYLLTDPGSTFLLQPLPGRSDMARERLEALLRSGIPLLPGLREFYGLPHETDKHWERCPYVPTNGYGEISVNSQSIWKEA
jgi:hypothetical protein